MGARRGNITLRKHAIRYSQKHTKRGDAMARTFDPHFVNSAYDFRPEY